MSSNNNSVDNNNNQESNVQPSQQQQQQQNDTSNADQQQEQPNQESIGEILARVARIRSLEDETKQSVNNEYSSYSDDDSW